MQSKYLVVPALALAGVLAATSTASAAVYAPSAARSGAVIDAAAGSIVSNVQYRYSGPRGYYGGPRGYYAPPRAYGYGPGPGWGYRAWYRRPYYGRIIGGVALGTIIVVTAYGIAPPRPRPDLCWYWSDRDRTSGYWDYC